jgi:hypothetical protein
VLRQERRRTDHRGRMLSGQQTFDCKELGFAGLCGYDVFWMLYSLFLGLPVSQFYSSRPLCLYCAVETTKAERCGRFSAAWPPAAGLLSSPRHTPRQHQSQSEKGEAQQMQNLDTSRSVTTMPAKGLTIKRKHSRGKLHSHATGLFRVERGLVILLLANHRDIPLIGSLNQVIMEVYLKKRAELMYSRK